MSGMTETRNRLRAVAAGTALAATLALAPGAGAAVLHDQYDNFGPDSGLLSGDPPGANNAALAADDFVVPSGQTWSLDGVDFRSQDGGAFAANVFVYANAGSGPGALVTSQLNLPHVGSLKDRSVVLSPAVALQPGTYWIGVQGTNSWGWVERGVQTGLPAVWMTQQDGHPCEDVFMPKATCGITGTPDQVFRINGTSTPIPVATPPAKKKGCKQIKSKQKRKKCKRKQKKKKKAGKR